MTQSPNDKQRHHREYVGNGRVLLVIDHEHVKRVIKARRDLCIGESYAPATQSQ